MNAIIMTEEYWAHSPFSVARYYGTIKVSEKQYTLVNKDGITIFELSHPTSKHYVGDDNMAIPPGEPADLVLNEWIPIYRHLGRARTHELVKQNVSLGEALLLIPEDMRPKQKQTKTSKKRNRTK